MFYTQHRNVLSTHELCFKIRSYIVSHLVNWRPGFSVYQQLNTKSWNKKQFIF